jgi:hypothetical protein
VLETREALTQASVDRLFVPADANPLGVRMQVESRGVEKGRAVVDLTLAYPAPPSAAGGDRGRAPSPTSVQAIGFCAVRNGPLSEAIDLGGPAESTPIGEAVWLVRTGRARLKPGAYRCSFAVRDEPTGITSYLTFDRSFP